MSLNSSALQRRFLVLFAGGKATEGGDGVADDMGGDGSVFPPPKEMAAKKSELTCVSPAMVVVLQPPQQQQRRRFLIWAGKVLGIDR